MMLRAYSIYDMKALQYHPPFYASTDAAAVRMVRDLVNDNNSTLSRHPADYVLYCVGLYDDQKGALLPEVPLVHIADCAALVAVAPTPLFPQKDVA